MKLTTYIRRAWRENLVVVAWIIVYSGCVTMFGLGCANILTYTAKLQAQRVVFWLGMLVITSVIWCIEIYTRNVCYNKAIQYMDTLIRQDVLVDVSKMSSNNYDELNKYVSWLTNDINTINDYGFADLYMAFQQLVLVFMSVLAILQFHITMIITVVLLLIVMILVPKKFTGRISKSSKRYSDAMEKGTSVFSDFLEGLLDLFSFGVTKVIVNKGIEASESIARGKVDLARSTGLLSAVSNLISLISQVVLTGQSALLFFLHAVPIGTITAARYFSGNIFANLTGLIANVAESKTVIPIFDKFNKIHMSNDVVNISLPEAQSKATPLTIVFTNVTFAYNGGSTLINHFTREFIGGRKYALIGDSGTGKSTLLKIMLGQLTPISGDVAIGDVEYARLTRAQIQNQFVYIPQSPHIFNESLLFNITLGAEVENNIVADAVRKAGLMSLIQSHVEGMDYIISENGKNLSGGQRQRIAVARGLVVSRKIWLVDEATSALDVDSSDEIEDILLGMNDITLILISHHLTTEQRAKFDEVVKLHL